MSASSRLSGRLWLCYARAAVFALFYASCMPLIPVAPRPAGPSWRETREANSSVLDYEQRRATALEQLSAGIRFVWNTKIILATLTLDLFAVLLGGAVYLLPVFAKDILGVGTPGFGWLRAADALGALTMAVVIAHTPPMKKAGRAMLWAVAL